MSHGPNGKGRMIRLPKSRLAVEVPQEPSRDLMDVLRMIEDSETPPRPRTLPRRKSDPPATLERLPMPSSRELAPPQPLVRKASFQATGGYDPTFRRKAGGVGDYFNPGQRTGRATQETTGQDGTLIETGMVTQTNGVIGPSGSAYAGEVQYLPQYQSTPDGAPATVEGDVGGYLQTLSELAGAPVLVSSGVRTEAQRQALVAEYGPERVARYGAHAEDAYEGAADIQIEGYSPEQTARLAWESGLFSRVNIYPDGSIHVDNRPTDGSGFYRNWQRTATPDDWSR